MIFFPEVRVMKKPVILAYAAAMALCACLTARPDNAADIAAGKNAAVESVKSSEDRASVNGKYRDLIQKLHVPEDVAQYGEFNDYGHWTGREYRGQQVSPGFWVYVSPDWYVWRTQTDLPRPEENLATVNGKYGGLLQSVLCPKDRQQYGDFHDYGYWSESDTYCGQQVRGGFWVYRHPYWYVWSTQKDLPRPDENTATVNGKYSGLLQAVLCPGDRERYGEFSDYGYWADSDRYCGQRVRGGYWVYRYPYWYIWQMSSSEDQWK